jgi:glyoxylase I family protein
MPMRIKLSSVMVEDQDRALKFYTEVLGFVKKHEIPVGEYRWITVTSPEPPTEVELSLEPNANPAAKTQQAMFKQESLTAFGRGHRRRAPLNPRRRLHDRSTSRPVKIASFGHLGNLIQIYQPPA